MARKARQRISYVLPLASSAGGHRLGVNGLAVDSHESILYSGGRDGSICAWDLHLNLQNPPIPEYDSKPVVTEPTTLRQQVQAHTHWINDIALAHSNRALVSASSDITVKLWRPGATDGLPPQSIGFHSDYVKRLAIPSPTSDWVASGGLDRQINVWDLSGAGKKLGIAVGEDERGSMLSTEKGSIYALAATETIIASGGPEGTVRVWDSRTGKRVTKLVGHTDLVRDVLISQDGATIWTASGDQTVKVWSTTAGRCMFTLTMHDASVWSLFSADPDLSVVYSSDRNGLVAKTDTRNCLELDEGLSVAICQEQEGVHKLVAAGDCIWTATSRPSINRWRDVNTENAEIGVPDNINMHRSSIATQRSRYPSPPSQRENSFSAPGTLGSKRKLPFKHMLRLSNTAYFPVPLADVDLAAHPSRNGTDEPANTSALTTQPVRPQPDFSIEGQTGLIKHVMLNDRRRVLTLDTAGDVVMWDLLKCVPIQSFGKRHLDDVRDAMTTNTTVANWCTVNTRTGTVTVVLEENTCFDAEMYADELDLDPSISFKEDHRINLGKWVLRYLFSRLIAEEVERDDLFRHQLMKTHDSRKRLQRDNAPSRIQLPQNQVGDWQQDPTSPTTASTLKPGANGIMATSTVTPGLNIALATPFQAAPAVINSTAGHPLSPTREDGAPLEKRTSHQSQRNSDYFSSPRLPSMDRTSPGGSSQPAVTPGEPATPSTEGAPNVPTTPGKEGLWGKKFRMNMSFSGMKKIARTQTNDKPAAVEEKDENGSDSRSSNTNNSRLIEDTLLGTVQKIRFSYEDSLQRQVQNQQAHENGLPVPASEIGLPSAITPADASDTPLLRLPLNTTVLIQEERPEAGGVADLFEGTVGAMGEMCDLVERTAPMWLGDVLLKNQLPPKDVVKISFVLEPWQNLLPTIASDGNNRLNANRMLRAKKIMAYVAERIEPPSSTYIADTGDELKPEDYLELWCQNQLVSPSMTLATIRSHLWKGGSDVLLYYKANGRKAIRPAPQTSGYPTRPSITNG